MFTSQQKQLGIEKNPTATAEILGEMIPRLQKYINEKHDGIVALERLVINPMWVTDAGFGFSNLIDYMDRIPM